MNSLEELVTMLPQEYRAKIDSLGCTFDSVDCESLNVVGEYIEALQPSDGCLSSIMPGEKE